MPLTSDYPFSEQLEYPHTHSDLLSMRLHSLHLRDFHLLHLLMHLVEIDVRDLGVFSVKDLGHFLQCHTARFNEKQCDEDHFEQKPSL
jgi:hypothetical protein